MQLYLSTVTWRDSAAGISKSHGLSVADIGWKAFSLSHTARDVMSRAWRHTTAHWWNESSPPETVLSGRWGGEETSTSSPVNFVLCVGFGFCNCDTMKWYVLCICVSTLWYCEWRCLVIRRRTWFNFRDLNWTDKCGGKVVCDFFFFRALGVLGVVVGGSR